MEERAAVDLLVNESLPRVTLPHPKLPPYTELVPSSTLMQQELHRINKGQKLDAIDLKRYEDLALPTNREQLDAWRQIAKRHIVASEALSGRIENLDLLKSFGAIAWTTHLYQLEFSLQQMEAELLTLRQQVERVNVERKQSQLAAGEKLSLLDHKWRELVSSNLEVSIACTLLETELGRR